MASIRTGGAATHIPVMDYENSQYRSEFWNGQGRTYEDATERQILRQLMPMQGGRIAEIGAGFGRLADLYLGYDQIILFDYSRTLLQDAVRDRGGDPRFVFIAGNLYTLPLASGVLDTLVMVRVMHHLADVLTGLCQLERTLHRYSIGVLEYANKRNLKAILRWAMGRQSWSPYSPEPEEFVKLNFDFHPDWMESRFQEAGLHVKQRAAVSHFRLEALKQRFSGEQLAGWERYLYWVGGVYPLSPSVFVQVTGGENRLRSTVSAHPQEVGALFRCPQCGTEGLEQEQEDRVGCPGCGSRYGRKQGVWDFKESL